jgi:hypothetical protein
MLVGQTNVCLHATVCSNYGIWMRHKNRKWDSAFTDRVIIKGFPRVPRLNITRPSALPPLLALPTFLSLPLKGRIIRSIFDWKKNLFPNNTEQVHV